MTCGPVAILILTNTEDTYLDEHGIKTKYKSPIDRWKEMIGNKDPAVAKADKTETLRGLFGTSIIKNGFYGSDTPSDAYRELSMLMLPLPSVPPKYIYDEKLINMKTVLNFLIPEKPDHPDVSGRLDLMGKYGPIVNYHLLDCCICKNCKGKVREKLKAEGKTLKQAKDKILTDEFIDKYNNIFCGVCLKHFDRWSHLMGGLEGTHIMTNEEIELAIYDMNKEDLYQVLYAEKGTSAKTILGKFDLKIYPPEIIYSKEHIKELFKVLETDYYDRYDFYDVQALINEDRRIRLNFWVSKMIDKPIDQFPNPKLLNFTGEEKEIKDMKNPKSKNFTLLRHKPIEVKNKDKNKLKSIVLQHPILQKDKLTNHEIALKNEKLLAKNISMVNPESLSNVNVVSNLLLLRNYELEAIKSKEAKDEIKREKERLNQLKYK